MASAPRIFTKLVKPILSELRKMGVTCLSYIDDIYIQANSKEECTRGVILASTLFQKLGFLIHPEKSVQEPKNILVFLGFELNSQTMTIKPKLERITNTLNEIKTFKRKHKKTIRDLAHIIGILVSLMPGVQYGPLHYREMETMKTALLQKYNGNFDAQINMSNYEELDWWQTNLPSAYKHIVETSPDLILETDASLSGWGAFCPTLSTKAQGKWSPKEKGYHINVLELMAVQFALKALCSKGNFRHIRIFTDSSTTVAYIKSMGGTHSLQCNNVAKAIWTWAELKLVWLSCCHLPGRCNTTADNLSRKFRSNTEWMLNPEVFHTISSLWGKFQIDLFASRLNKQLNQFASWKPDSDALYVDAFSFNWHKFYFYAFPPFSLIARVLQKVQMDQAEGIIIVPHWPTQHWYTKVLSMTTDTPRLLPMGKNLLTLPEDPQLVHPLYRKLQLVACRVSGNASKVARFQTTLPPYSWHHGKSRPKNNTAVIMSGGLNSAKTEKLVYFSHL